MSPHTFLAYAAAVLLLLGMCACAVPLAPGYRIVKESREIRFSPGEKPGLRIRAEYRLKNSGTTDLEFIDVDLPDEKTYGRSGLRVVWVGRDSNLSVLPEQFQPAEVSSMRLPFASPWKRGQEDELSVEYTFNLPTDIGDRITLGAEDFHLGARGWSPVLEPPKHFLSPFPSRPEVTSYTVVVPNDFLVLGGGRLKARKASGTGETYTFELRRGDLSPSVIAGKYVTSASSENAGAPVFWTLEPLKQDPRAASESITAVWNALENDFGPLDKNVRSPHIAESASLREHLTGEVGPAAAAFPGGVLVNPALLSLGVASDAFQARVTHALAHNWFGDEVYFGRFTALGLGEGLPEYASIVAEEAAKGTAARRRRVSAYLHEYDEARDEAEENPLGVSALSDPPGQQRIALAKAAMVFVAVEDVCGGKPMRDGLKQLITLLRGQEVDYDTLRSQLERSSGKNLADLFRVWLNEKGVPADFRARYEISVASAPIRMTPKPRQTRPIGAGVGFSGGNVKEVIATEKGPKAIGPYSQAIKAGGFIYTAGQIPFDPSTGQLIHGDVAEQTARVLENLKAIVEAAGSVAGESGKGHRLPEGYERFRGHEREHTGGYFTKNPPRRGRRWRCRGCAARCARGDRSGGIGLSVCATNLRRVAIHHFFEVP